MEDGPEAMVDFVNFLLRSAGCKLEVTRDDIDDVDNTTSRVGDLQDEYQNVSCQTDLCAGLLTINSKMLQIIPSSRKPRAVMHFETLL